MYKKNRMLNCDDMEVRHMARFAVTEYNKSAKSSLQMERVVSGLVNLKDDGKQFWMVVRCKDKDGNSKNYDVKVFREEEDPILVFKGLKPSFV